MFSLLTRHPFFKSAWRPALFAGFVVQLLLILFVTSIGLGQLEQTADELDSVVDVHMRKQNLAKTMVGAARERTVNLFRMVESEDPFERDDLLMRFNGNAGDFIAARRELLNLPLTNHELALLDRQRQVTDASVKMQGRVIELLDVGLENEAEALLLKQSIPAQDKVLDALTRLAATTESAVQDASAKAHRAHGVARFWMVVLSAAALLVGVLVAIAVIYYANRASREREHLATHDVLTGLPNRMLFMDRLEQAIARAQRRSALVGVMFIDLDRFKRVNDTLGHASGDKLICEVAARLRGALRAEDIVARLGGDEFVVVVADIGKINHILHTVEKVMAVVTNPYQIDGRELFVSCSIGVSIYPNDGDNSTVLVKYADTAMYHAKNNGRNRFQLYDGAMNAMAEGRLQLETDLHYALERNEFVFHYQPQLDLETGRICAVEALLRWNHPKKGLLSPAAFLELLEETGVIVPVGRKLLTDACIQTASWRSAGFSDLNVAVNVSSKEFWHEALISNVDAALAASGLSPCALKLELTEGILMQDTDRAVSRILALKELGIGIAIDDFGTGYSSLAHLKRFPLDCLKIDRYFVKDIQDAPINEALIGSILALCHGMHLESVAEGVEDAQQLERLRELGCQIVQGYLISRPVPADQVAELLARDWRDEFGRNAQSANLLPVS